MDAATTAKPRHAGKFLHATTSHAGVRISTHPEV